MIGLEFNQKLCWLIVSHWAQIIKIVGKLRVASCVQQFFLFQLWLTKWIIWIVLNCWNLEEVANHGSCELVLKTYRKFFVWWNHFLLSKKFAISIIFNVFFFFDFFEMFYFFERLLGFNWEVSHMLTWKSERCRLFFEKLVRIALEAKVLVTHEGWLNMSFRNLWPMNFHCTKQIKTSTLIAW